LEKGGVGGKEVEDEGLKQEASGGVAPDGQNANEDERSP